MHWLKQAIDFILHLDKHLNDLVAQYHTWSYLILFGIVFCETGLVVMPFLPGDSLLFACGALAATKGSPLSLGWLFVILTAAAILGDTVNYQIGHFLGPKVFTDKHRKWLKKEHLERTHAFFEKYGGKTIILARFVPIVRTFAPFVAGIGAMTYWKFLVYNVVGGVVWVAAFLLAGYWFGRLKVIQENFALVTLAIVIISLLPIAYEVMVARQAAKETKEAKEKSKEPA